MKIKKMMGLITLMTIILVVSIGCAQNPEDEKSQDSQNDVDVNEDGDKSEDEDSNSAKDPMDDSKYINYAGRVKEIMDSEENQITVDGEGEESDFEKITFNLTDETVIVDEENQEIIDAAKIKEGDRVEVIYGKDTPMTRSLPPIVNARALVIRHSEPSLGIKVSEFNEGLISKDNTLELKINEDTSIVDLQGNTLRKEDIIDKEILVLYGPEETLSIPGQSNAIKIILL